jgi:hypothetical protein
MTYILVSVLYELLKSPDATISILWPTLLNITKSHNEFITYHSWPSQRNGNLYGVIGDMFLGDKIKKQIHKKISFIGVFLPHILINYISSGLSNGLKNLVIFSCLAVFKSFQFRPIFSSVISNFPLKNKTSFHR